MTHDDTSGSRLIRKFVPYIGVGRPRRASSQGGERRRAPRYDVCGTVEVVLQCPHNQNGVPLTLMLRNVSESGFCGACHGMTELPGHSSAFLHMHGGSRREVRLVWVDGPFGGMHLLGFEICHSSGTTRVTNTECTRTHNHGTPEND